jgi:hypothetical protein
VGHGFLEEAASARNRNSTSYGSGAVTHYLPLNFFTLFYDPATTSLQAEGYNPE